MKWNTASFSAKVSLLSAGFGLVTLISFCLYGAIYDYFDIAVFVALALGAACAVGYAQLDKAFAQLLNLASVACTTFGLGLFFLNSYPVWADRLNHITMYGSRGTLVPVVAIMILSFVTILAEILSCFTRKEAQQ